MVVISLSNHDTLWCLYMPEKAPTVTGFTLSSTVGTASTDQELAALNV
jgi:hypothetical protein